MERVFNSSDLHCFLVVLGILEYTPFSTLVISLYNVNVGGDIFEKVALREMSIESI